mgnify:CR=1 FL=1
MQYTAVDLFCGAGGLTYGLEKAGIPVTVGIDADKTCYYPYTKNNEASFLNEDIRELSAKRLEDLYPSGSLKILAGCAPCQPFSSLGRGQTCNSEKWGLLSRFGEYIKAFGPPLVTMENVPGLLDHSIFDDFISILENHNYHVFKKVIDARNYNVPQQRERLVLLGSKLGPISIIDPQTPHEYKTVRGAIQKLPQIEAGGQDESDRLHKSAGLSKKNLKRIRASSPGGTWKDWPEHLRLKCHRKDSGSSYTSIYGRMEWDKSSPTITTQFYTYGTGRFGHPEQDRAISFREAALLQSFPHEYSFMPPRGDLSMKDLGRLIGNAVPVNLAYAIGISIKKHLKEV